MIIVIKTHALIESAVSKLLNEIICITYSGYMNSAVEVSLEKPFSWMDLSNNRTGKLAFLKGLKILFKEQRRFINTLSELRNEIIHNVSNVNFNFENFLKNLNKNQFKKYNKAFNYFLDEEIETGGKTYTPTDVFRSNPKLTIWICMYNCLSEIYYCSKYFKLSHKRINIGKKENTDTQLGRDIEGEKVEFPTSSKK